MSASKKIYLHHESEEVSITTVEHVIPSSTISDLLERFSSALDAQKKSDGRSKSSLFLQKSNGKKLNTESKRALIDHVEDKEDIFVCYGPCVQDEAKLTPELAVKKPAKDYPVAAPSVSSSPSPSSSSFPSSSTLAAKTLTSDESAKIITKLKQYFHAKRYREVRIACEQLLAVNSRADSAMLLLAEVYFATERYEKCVECCQKLWRTQGKSLDLNVLLAKAQLRAGNFEEALEVTVGAKGVKSSGLSSKQLLDRQLELSAVEAECVFEMGNAQGGAEVINKTMTHPEAEANVHILTAYSYFATRHGKVEEPMRALLKAVTLDQGNKRVKDMLADLLRTDTGISELYKQVPASPSSAPAFAFLGTVAKDHSALKAALHLYQTALRINPVCASYALNAMHIEEIQAHYGLAVDILVDFFKAIRAPPNVTISEGDVSSRMLEILRRARGVKDMSRDDTGAHSSAFVLQWEQERDCFSVLRAHMMELGASAASAVPVAVAKPLVKYTADELDWLALGMGAVKLLFLQGKLWALPPILEIVEELRVKSSEPLHLSSIRNEQAYSMAIAQIIASACDPTEIANEQYAYIRWMLRCSTGSDGGEDSDDCPAVVREALSNPLYVVGDSHSLSPAWSIVRVKTGGTGEAKARLLVPKLATGAKQWHLRNESKFYPKANFTSVVSSIPNGADVIVILGEIDCREGMLQAVEADKYAHVKDAMKCTVRLFVEQVLKTTLLKKKKFNVFIHPVVPVLNETRTLVLAFNQMYEAAVKKVEGLAWMDFCDNLLEIDAPCAGAAGSSVDERLVIADLPTAKESLRPEYKLDGTHLHPRYVNLIQTFMDRR